MVACVMLCFAGCGDEYDNFKPAGVYIIDYISGTQYEYIVDDQETAEKMWKYFDKLEIYENEEAEIGGAYLFMKFYNKDGSTEAIFTIYENGSCCLARDYETLYTVENGRSAYIDLVEIYESYVPEKEVQ